MTLFEQGLVRYLLGDDAEAARLLHAASAADRDPIHANDRINAATRQVAQEHAGDDGLRFVDVEALVRAQMPQGLVGYEIMQGRLPPAPRGAADAGLAAAAGDHRPRPQGRGRALTGRAGPWPQRTSTTSSLGRPTIRARHASAARAASLISSSPPPRYRRP